MFKKIINSLVNKLGFHLTLSSKFPGVSLEKLSNLKKRLAILEAKNFFGNKKIVSCEIGAFEGEHALQILKNLNVSKLYLIDPYEIYDEYKGDSYCKKVSIAKLKAHALLEPYRKKIVWIEKYSDEGMKYIKDKIDFLYIDGNHFSPFIDKDIKNYYPLVSDKGIISGHDYGNSYSDVKKAVNTFSSKINKKLSFGLGNDWVIFK